MHRATPAVTADGSPTAAPSARPALTYLPVPGPLPGGALAALTVMRGRLTMLLDAGAHPGATTMEAGALEAALRAGGRG